MYLPTPRAGADYATAAELLVQDDRPTMDVKIPDWKRADGSPIYVQIRALSLDDRQWINQVAGVGEQRNHMLFVLATIQRGVVRPQLEWAQAMLLKDRNERILDILCDTIWELSGLDQAKIDALVEQLAGARLPAGPESAPVGGAGDGAPALAGASQP